MPAEPRLEITCAGAPVAVLREVFASVGITQAPMPYLVARAGDGRKCAYVWEDAIADDVVLATHLNGGALDDRHGAPLRLVSPSQYGYKSVKHVTPSPRDRARLTLTGGHGTTGHSRSVCPGTSAAHGIRQALPSTRTESPADPDRTGPLTWERTGSLPLSRGWTV
jgi:hypothetical protein